MTIRYVETDHVSDLIAQCADLQREHYDELAKNKTVMVLAPDVEQYRRIEQAGMLFAVIAYDGDQIVGYSVNVLATNLHYSTLLMAQNDVLFVGRAHRAGRLGMRLIEMTKALAAKRGARMMLWHAKEGTPLAGILPRLGCKVQDIIYSAELPASNFRLHGSFDAAAAAIEQAECGLWDYFTARQDAPGSAHHDTRCILMRGPAADELTEEVWFNTTDSIDTGAVPHLPEVSALVAAACDRLKVQELGRVMLVELAPGGHIDRHVDEGAYAAHFSRFHLALQSDAGNVFHNGADQIHMQPGELWQFNPHAEHEVFNRSDRPRIHLIIDATTA